MTSWKRKCGRGALLIALAVCLFELPALATSAMRMIGAELIPQASYPFASGKTGFWTKSADNLPYYHQTSNVDVPVLTNGILGAYQGAGSAAQNVILSTSALGTSTFRDNATPLGTGVIDVTNSAGTVHYLTATSAGNNTYGPLAFGAALQGGWWYLSNTSLATAGTPVQSSIDLQLSGTTWDGAASRGNTGYDIGTFSVISGSAAYSADVHFRPVRAGALATNDTLTLSYNGTVQEVIAPNPGLGAGTTPGVSAQNTTNTQAGSTLQYGPSFESVAHGWNTTTSADWIEKWQMFGRPLSGTTAAMGGELAFQLASGASSGSPAYVEYAKLTGYGGNGGAELALSGPSTAAYVTGPGELLIANAHGLNQSFIDLQNSGMVIYGAVRPYSDSTWNLGQPAYRFYSVETLAVDSGAGLLTSTGTGVTIKTTSAAGGVGLTLDSTNTFIGGNTLLTIATGGARKLMISGDGHIYGDSGINTSLYLSAGSGTILSYGSNYLTLGSASLTLTATNDVTIAGGLRLNHQSLVGANTPAATDCVYSVIGSGARTINIPTPASVAGKLILVKDTIGNSSLGTITIVPAAGNIDGSANATITTNFGGRLLYSDGTNYFILAIK